MEDVKDQVVDPTTNTQNAVKGIESYVLADVDPNFTYKNPSVNDALKFNMNEIKVSPKIAKVSTKSEAHNDILVKNEKERSLWDKSVRVWDAFSSGAIERSDIETQTSELWFKKLQADSPNIGADEFTGEDILKLDELDKKLQSLPNYDENFAEVVSGAIGSSVGTLARNVKDVAPLVAGASVTAGAAGAFVGGPVLGVAAAQGMLATTAGPAIMYKAYKQQAGQAYGDLLKNKPVLFSGSPFQYAGKEDNQPFQFDSFNDTERYRYIAHGVGVVNGLLEGLFTKGVAKTVPWIKKLMINPKTIDKVLTPSQISVLTKFGQTAFQHGQNGLTEVAQEIVQVIGQKAGDKSFGDITFDDIFNEQTAERYALASAAGVGASVGLSTAGKTIGTTGSLTYKGFKSLGEAGNIESNKPKFTVTTDPEARAKAVKFKLQEQAAKESYDAVKSSAVKAQSEAAHNALLKDLHGDDNVYLRNDLAKQILAEDSVKAQKIRDKIGITITDESALTSITKDKYFQLLDLDEKFFNAVQFEEDGPIASEVDSYLSKFESNKTKAQELEAKINQVNDPAEKVALINQIADLEEVKFDEFSTVEEYVNQPVIPESLKTATVSDKLIKLEEDVKAVRKQVAEAELEVEKKKIGKMVKLDAEVQTEIEINQLENDLQNYKVYDTIDAFTNSNVGKTEFDNILNEGGNKYAINPETLPADLKKYAQDKTLKKYKVFTKSSENIKKIFHGTRGEFDGLPDFRSGGMVFYGETEDVAIRYSEGSGGGRTTDFNAMAIVPIDGEGSLRFNKDTEKWEGTLYGEKVSLTGNQIDYRIDEDLTVNYDNARVIENYYDSSKSLDITNDKNINIFLNVLKKLKNNKTASRLLNAYNNSQYKLYNINAEFWSQTKYASRLDDIKNDFIEITNALKNEGYESIRFNDDSHTTIALFDNNNTTVGIDAEESAQLLGYDSAEQMFKDMKLAEPRQQVISQYVQDRQESIKALSQEEIGFKPEVDIPRVLDNRAKLHLKEISTLMDNYKSSVKEGVRKIALPSMTRIEDLKVKAVQIAAALKVKDLNAKMFQVNETRMDKKAVKLFNQGDIRGALKAKENAAINTLVRKEVYDINKKLNRNIVKIAKLIANNGSKDLADAGEIYTEAFKTIVDTINLDRRFDQKAQQAYVEWATSVDESERAKYDLPKELKGNDKFSINDMSAQSALALTETALQIHATAKRKNKLVNKYEYINEQVKIQEVSSEISSRLQNRKDYKWHLYETRNARTDDSISAKFKKSIGTFIASHTRMEETIFRTILDRGENNGFFTNTFWKPMEDSRVYKSNLTSGVDTYISKAIEAYGTEKFYNLGYEIINDPRLKNTNVFGQFTNVPVTKLDLFTILLNFGNEGNIQALEKTFKLDRKDIKSILETHLTMDEVKLAQQHGLSFEGLWGDNVEMLKQMGENIPDRVVGQDFEFKGETVKGWYYPIALKPDELKLDRIANKGLALEKKDARYRAEILTFNGHNIERTKLDDGAVLNLDYGKFRQTIEEVSHDIAFRPALTDIGKLLGNVDIQRDLFNTLGEAQYNALQDWVESINNIPFESSRIEKTFDRAISKLITANQFAALGFNLGTILIQPSSMPIVFNRLSEDYNGNTLISRGDVLQDYARSAVNMFTMSPENIKNVIGEIGKYSPDFANRLKQMDVEINKAQFDLTPETGNKIWNNTKKLNQKIAFTALTQMNMRMNAATWVTAYRLAESGKIKGIKVGDEQASIDYANSVIRTELEANDALDKSSIQRQRGAIRLFTSFYSQMNVLTNKFISAGYAANIEWMNTEGLPIKDKLKKRAEIAAQLAGRFLFTAVIPAAIVGSVRGIMRDKEEEFTDYIKNGAFQIADSFIGLRDVSYIMQTGAKRTPTIPVYQNMLDVALVGNGMIDLALSPLKDESFQFTKKEIDAMWRSSGLVGVPARPLKYLFNLYDENSESFDFLDGASVTSAIKEMSDKVGSVTTQDSKDMLKQDAEEAFKDVDDPQSQEILQDVKSKVEPIDSFSNPEGSEVYLSDVNKIQSFSASEAKTMNLFMAIARQAESGNNPNAVNPYTNAAGYYQFIPSTWKALSKQYPDLGLGQNVPTGKDTIARQNKAMWKLSAKNWYRLKKEGLDTNPTTLYTMHLLGEDKDGTRKGIGLLKASSGTKALNVLNKNELLLNPKATLGMNNAQAVKADLSKVTVEMVKNNIRNYLLENGKSLIKDLKLAKDEESTLITKLTEQL